MVTEDEKKLFYDYIDDSINKIKSEKKSSLDKLEKFRQIINNIEKDLGHININNYKMIFGCATNDLLASWLKLHTEQLYDMRIETLKNYVVTFNVINKIFENEKVTKEKLPNLEKSIKNLMKSNKRFEPFLDEIDKQIENYRKKENELRKRGIYG